MGCNPDAAREGIRAGATFEKDEIVCVTGGDGSTSEGEFYEGLSSACLKKLPILFLIEDNGWAITTASSIQWAGSLVEWAKGGGEPGEGDGATASGNSGKKSPDKIGDKGQPNQSGDKGPGSPEQNGTGWTPKHRHSTHGCVKDI